MYDSVLKFLESQGVVEYADLYTSLVISIIGFLFGVILDFIIRRFLIRAVVKFVRKTESIWDDALITSKALRHLSHLAIPIALIIFMPVAFEENERLESIALVITHIIFTLIVARTFLDLVSAISIIYERIRPDIPIKGVIQLIKIIVYLFSLVAIISIIIHRSPLVILSGLGAVTAVLILVFKDVIIGFITTLQIAANKLVRVGDWIEFPESNLEGVVEEISLTTIKIRGFDLTVYRVPATDITTKPFKNWYGIEEKKARRMYYTVYISPKSVKFLSDNELKAYKNQPLMKHVKQNQRITNLELFRANIFDYILNHHLTDTTFLTLVYLNPATENGIPIVLYAHSSDFSFAGYTNYASQVTEFVAASAKHFNIELYQFGN